MFLGVEFGSCRSLDESEGYFEVVFGYEVYFF